jgi:hypothetical protein
VRIQELPAVQPLHLRAQSSAASTTQQQRSAYYKRPCHEFRVTLRDDPVFDKQLRDHGRRIAYHGSRFSNFWSILNRGLRNCSGTKEEKTGAVFGDGVYLAADLDVAKLFAAGKCAGWNKSSLLNLAASHLNDADDNSSTTSASALPPSKCWLDVYPYEIVAVCDVVALPENQNEITSKPSNSVSDSSSTYFVVPNERHVRVHSLLLFHLPTTAAAASKPVVEAVPGGDVQKKRAALFAGIAFFGAALALALPLL